MRRSGFARLALNRDRDDQIGIARRKIVALRRSRSHIPKLAPFGIFLLINVLARFGKGLGGLARMLRLKRLSHYSSGATLIIDLTEYLERRRRTAEARALQIATVSRHGGRVAQHRAAGIPVRRGLAGAVRWSSLLPLLPVLELGTLYAEASLI